jgi:hypothetical protein
MARNNGLRTGEVTVLRSATATIAADNATLTDANIPPAQGVGCQGLDTVLVGVEITGGSSPTMTIEALVRDGEAADGARWKRMTAGLAFEGTPTIGDTGALDGTAFVELPTFGASLVFFRIKAVANAGSTTAWKILGMPGRARPGHTPFR